VFRYSCVQVTEQQRHVKEYATQDLKVRQTYKVGRGKTNLILRWGKAEEQRREIWVRI
jgi:hypothetical protein